MDNVHELLNDGGRCSCKQNRKFCFLGDDEIGSDFIE